MSLAKMTLIGLYNFYEDDDPIFKKLVLPDGIDKDLFINSLLLDAGEFEVLYADPDFLQNAIGIWGKKWFRTFKKWYEALEVEYDPLNNYDRTEIWTTKRDSSENRKSNSNESMTRKNKMSGEDRTNTNTNRSAYDSSSLVPYENINSTSDTSGLNEETGTGKTVENTDVSGAENETRNGRAFGNIGVTTSQQMLESELNLQEWNLYQHMIDLFKTELLIPIY